MTNVQSDTGVLAGSGAKFDVIHPASEEVAGQATDGRVVDKEHLRRALDRGGLTGHGDRFADRDPIGEVKPFGPVLTVTPFDTDDAIAIADNSIDGLSGEVSSADVDRALAVAQRMRTGNVTINSRSHFGINSPFGGTKQSGLGRRNGEEGF